ncbi:cutinase [Plectosphaerella cucumerina]|jgi:cutinase|uniref:Cutinase n=1 Tax=Plectosphaerella cucumerina TaxID=40658 RepID=A0A8K0T7D1_9PEZI|nr:cutinase [Plectosphaerella cucumerina]
MLPDGTSAAAITEMVGLFEKAAQQCPQATIVTGGYSQGSALCAAAVRDVSPDVRSKIAGAVLFGYTKVSRLQTTFDRLESLC